MEVYKRVILFIFIFYSFSNLKSNDSLRIKKYLFTISTGVSYFSLRDRDDFKYYDGNYGGGCVLFGYERKYLNMELKYQFGRSRDAVYHFGEWNFGAKIDFLKRHRVSMMTGMYVYRTQDKINIILKDLPVYDLTYSHTIPVGYRNINYSIYQGGSNFMIMDISTGKFRWAGTNLFYLLWMHLKMEYSFKITRTLNLSVHGCTYFSNSINKYISLYTDNNITSEELKFFEVMPTKYILNENTEGLPVYENIASHSKKTNYYVPNNILLNVGLCIKYKF